MNMRQYKEKHGDIISPQKQMHAVSVFPMKEIISKAMQELSPEEQRDTIVKSEMRVITKNFTKHASQLYFTTLVSRLEMFTKSVELATRVLNDLNHNWRVQMDDDGKPLKIADKIRIGEYANSVIDKISGGISNLMTWAISENKAVLGKPQTGTESVFSGKFDKLPSLIPDPQQREKIRLLTEILAEKMALVQRTVIEMEPNGTANGTATERQDEQKGIMSSSIPGDSSNEHDRKPAEISDGRSPGEMPQ
jgi:hypothetical protein